MRILLIIGITIGTLVLLVPKKVYITVSNSSRIEEILTEITFDNRQIFDRELKISTFPMNDTILNSSIGRHDLEITIPRHNKSNSISIVSIFNNYIDLEITQDEVDSIVIIVRKSYFPLIYQ